MTTHCITSDYDLIERTKNPESDLPHLVQWWMARRQRQLNRAALKEMATLDDRMLKDIGLHRGDVSFANSLADSTDGMGQLETLARHRSGRC